MCEDYWEWELARRRRLLAVEDLRAGELDEDAESLEDKPEPVVLPPPPLVEEKRRARPMLAR